MRITTHTDYALRTLMYLAANPEHRATIADISRSYGISENHLTKVVHQLGQEGVIRTVRGRQGGIHLARPPETIRLGDIVRKMEADLDIAPCFSGSGMCAIQPRCRLQRAFKEALNAFLAALDDYTLAELVQPRKGLAAFLGIESGPATAERPAATSRRRTAPAGRAD